MTAAYTGCVWSYVNRENINLLLVPIVPVVVRTVCLIGRPAGKFDSYPEGAHRESTTFSWSLKVCLTDQQGK